MAKTQYLEYTVHLSDEAVVKSYNTQYPKGLIRAPYNPGPPAGGMAVEAANAMGLTPPLPMVNVGFPTIPNSLTSTWFDNSNTFPRNVATFTRSTGWWIFGSNTKFYWVAKFAYMPASTQAPSPVEEVPGVTPPTPDVPDVEIQAAIPERYVINGFELNGNTEGINFGSTFDSKTGIGAPRYDGVGFAMRQQGTTTNYQGWQPITLLGSNINKLWDRFRVRVRRVGTGMCSIYRVETGSTSGGGIRIYLSALGQLIIATANTAGETIIGTVGTPLVVDETYRFDCFCYCGPDINGTIVEMDLYLCINGELISITQSFPGGLVGNGNFALSAVGHPLSTATGGAEIDFDDWRSSKLPDDKDFKVAAYSGATTYNIGDKALWGPTQPMPTTIAEIARTYFHKPVLGFEIFVCQANGVLNSPPRNATTPKNMSASWKKLTDSADFLNGSRIVLARPRTAVTMANWTPAVVQHLAQAIVNDDNLTNAVHSTTALANIQLLTDAKTRAGAIPGSLGMVSFMVGVRSFKGTNNGQVGYKLGAAAPVLTAITETGSFTRNRAMYSPPGATAPIAVPDIEVHYQKGNDAVQGGVTQLAAAVEIIGIFAPEDRPKIWDPPNPALTPPFVGAWKIDAAIEAPSQPIGLHNAPWPSTPWFRSGLAPLGPVMIVGGTYVGNGTGQDLTFKQPPAWIWFRPTSLASPGAKWFSAMHSVGGIVSNWQGLGYVIIPDAYKDETFVPGATTDDQQMSFKVRIATADPSVNQNGVTYQYIAFCDPGGRFCLTGGSSHGNDAAFLPVTDVLERTPFLPEFGFFHRGGVGTTSTSEHYIKGTGHAADGATPYGGATAPVATAITFGDGTLTFGSNFIGSTSTYDFYAWALFRRQDGNNNANAPKLMATGTYVGDGVAARTIATGQTTGLRPLWLMVVPLAAAAPHYRDPTHTGTTSQQAGGASQASTGISGGGIDSFTVGTSLNANGTTYVWLMFMASATAGNGGWGTNGEYTPVPSESPSSPVFTPPPDVVANDTATTVKNTPVTIDVLLNDLNEGVGFSITSTTSPAHGSVQISAGEIIYTPNTDYVGTDTFTYTATDGTDTGTATVTVTITATSGGGGGGGGDDGSGCRDNWGVGTSTDLPYVPLTP